jgi:hypothetical protein
MIRSARDRSGRIVAEHHTAAQLVPRLPAFGGVAVCPMLSKNPAASPKPGAVLTPQKAKLLAVLARALEFWRNAKDDDDGIKQKRHAAQLALGAFLEWASADGDIPAWPLQPLVELVSALDDLNRGKHPKLLKPSPGAGGNPGLETGDTAKFAASCVAADMLSEQEVARAIGMTLGAFRSRRKAFNSGQRGKLARSTCHEMRQIFQSLDPKEVRRLFSQIWR